jgi:hypothetical protein
MRAGATVPRVPPHQAILHLPTPLSADMRGD